MQTVSTNFNNAINASVRTVKARVKLYNGLTLVDTFTQSDALIKLEIQRTAEEGKFFGMCICQRLNVHLRDISRQISVTTANRLVVSLGVGDEYVSFPSFFVTEVNRDEKTNELSITAYDMLDIINEYTVSDVPISAPYTIDEFITAAATLFDKQIVKLNIGEEETCFDTEYEEGANFEGTESLKEVLRQVAEVTQTTIYIDSDDNICFKRLPSASSLSIDNSKYFSLKNSGNRRLQTICNATELGDNVSASTTNVGSTQYVRNNPFWELRDDIDTLVENAVDAVGDSIIGVVNCEWRGHPALEIGDKITFTAKDSSTFFSFLLDDTITYDGALKEITRYDFKEEEESASNPSSLGDTLKQTYAKVDKVNKQVEIVASEIGQNTQDIATLQLNTDSISASVTEIQTNLDSAVDSINEGIGELSSVVSTKMNASDVQLEISTALSNGVDKVVTTTGFTFDEEGITIQKTGSEMSTNIDEDGMRVSRDNTEVLTADNTGVNAINLTARQYLIVGRNSRFEDYGSRTGCFWIGG